MANRRRAWPSDRSPEPDGDLAAAEGALGALTEAQEAAVDELGPAVPPAQLRALPALAAAALVSLTALARQRRTSAPAASRLRDRLQQAGLTARRPGRGPAGGLGARAAPGQAGGGPGGHDAGRPPLAGLRELPAAAARPPKP